MAYFELEGIGRDTMRKRHRIIRAESAEAAILAASEDGTIVDVGTVKRTYPIRHFFSKVAGTSHENRDGSDRQRVIRNCARLENLVLRHERGNPYSSYAVAVITQAGEQAGYLADEVAASIVDEMRGGAFILCFANGVTGGDVAAGKPTFGLNVLVMIAADPETPEASLTDYLREAAASDERTDG